MNILYLEDMQSMLLSLIIVIILPIALNHEVNRDRWRKSPFRLTGPSTETPTTTLMKLSQGGSHGDDYLQLHSLTLYSYYQYYYW